jgi:hypothetical protein
MIKRMVALISALLVTIGLGVAVGAAPALAEYGCPTEPNPVFCMWDACPLDHAGPGGCLNGSAGSVPIMYASQTPRNQCESLGGVNRNISEIDNETSLGWLIFRTTTCGGSHVVVYGYSVMSNGYNLPWQPRSQNWPAGWDNSVRAVMRTACPDGC